MALNFRALLIPTAAIDSAGRAKPDAVFSVTPLAGGSPVPVYGSAEGGAALEAAQVKTDSLGNISGLYVAEPGPYTLSFLGGGTVVTSAVLDPRDVATSSDLADALGASSTPDYTYDGNTGLWSVVPGRSPGCAQFSLARGENGVSGLTTPGETLANMPLETQLANADVATLLPDGCSVRFAAPGLYLISLRGSVTYWGSSTAAEPEVYVAVAASGPLGPCLSWSNVHPDAINNWDIEFSASIPALCRDDVTSDLTLSVTTVTHSWAADAVLTIVRLD